MCGAVRLLPFLLIWMLLFLFHVSAVCGNRVQSEDKKKKKNNDSHLMKRAFNWAPPCLITPFSRFGKANGFDSALQDETQTEAIV